MGRRCFCRRGTWFCSSGNRHCRRRFGRRLIGSFVGGSAANSVSSAVLDEFIEDDAKEMVEIIEDVFKDMAGEFLISQKEAEKNCRYIKRYN